MLNTFHTGVSQKKSPLRIRAGTGRPLRGHLNKTYPLENAVSTLHYSSGEGHNIEISILGFCFGGYHMGHINHTTRPRLYPIALTLLAVVILMGCGSARTDGDIQTGDAPEFPSPEVEISDPLPLDDAVETVSSELQDCGQLWQPNALYQMMANSYHYGSYQPFVASSGLWGAGQLEQRGFRGRAFQQSSAMICANDLMQAAAFIQSQAQHYAPGAVETWLGSMVNYAYTGLGDVGVGYVNGNWGGYPPSAWGGSWTY